MLRLKRLTKYFAERVVLQQITADFAVGSRSVILGENGAGKSTLLRIIAGLTEPSAGTVSYELALSNELSQIERSVGQGGLKQSSVVRFHGCPRIGFVSSSLLAYPQLTVAQNLDLLYGALSSDRSPTALKQRLIAQFGLDCQLTTRLQQLSSGQRQRFQIVRAFLLSPQILLLDEPTSFLDNYSRTQLAELVQSFSGVCLATAHEADYFLQLGFSLYRLSGGGLFPEK